MVRENMFVCVCVCACACVCVCACVWHVAGFSNSSNYFAVVEQ